MAAEELKQEEQGQALELREKIENPGQLLQDSLGGLDKFGGFQLLKGLIKGVENMDPRRKAVKNIFLGDASYAEARKKLKNELELWVSIFEEGSSDPMEIIDNCKEKLSKAETNLKNNLFTVHDEVHKLEVTYRALDSFFANAGQGKVECLTLMNVNKEELEYHDSEDTLAIRRAGALLRPSEPEEQLLTARGARLPGRQHCHPHVGRDRLPQQGHHAH